MFFTQFGLLFTNMPWFVVVVFAVGIVCLTVELLQPGFGVFGITGVVCFVASIVLRAVFASSEDNIPMQILQFLLLEVLIVGLGLGLIASAQKAGWLKKGIFAVGTAVNPERSDGTADYRDLVGKEGYTLTMLRPVGRAKIGDMTYDVVSENFAVEKGESVTVVAVEGGKITVRKK